MQDLFRWGDPSATAPRPVEGFKVGTERLGDNVTDHYAFRQPGIDYQVWMDEGDKPLPRKMVITTLTDPAQPEYNAIFTWDLTPKIDAKAFTFVPGKDAVKIPLATTTATAAK